jgi:hypothetical protein
MGLQQRLQNRKPVGFQNRQKPITIATVNRFHFYQKPIGFQN